MTPEGKARQRAAVTKHGHAGDGTGRRRPSPTYSVWRAIRTRCFNTSSKDYPRYGGAGITMCQAWADDFLVFLRDMGERPSVHHTIDRLDNTRGYEPGNCRWATDAEQNNNRTNNLLIEFRGEKKTASQWAHTYNLPPSLLIKRIRRGWGIDEALMTPNHGTSRKNTKKRCTT